MDTDCRGYTLPSGEVVIGMRSYYGKDLRFFPTMPIPAFKPALCRLHKCVLGAWPAFCGYNRVAAKQDSQVLADVYGDPFIVTAPYGEGRTLAFTSDCTPDWATQAFLDWDGSGRFFQNAVRWLAGRL